MTSYDRNASDRNDDLVPAQEKLEWVTPKISLMGAEDTEGKTNVAPQECMGQDPCVTYVGTGPS